MIRTPISDCSAPVAMANANKSRPVAESHRKGGALKGPKPPTKPTRLPKTSAMTKGRENIGFVAATGPDNVGNLPFHRSKRTAMEESSDQDRFNNQPSPGSDIPVGAVVVDRYVARKPNAILQEHALPHKATDKVIYRDVGATKATNTKGALSFGNLLSKCDSTTALETISSRRSDSPIYEELDFKYASFRELNSDPGSQVSPDVSDSSLELSDVRQRQMQALKRSQQRELYSRPSCGVRIAEMRANRKHERLSPSSSYSVSQASAENPGKENQGLGRERTWKENHRSSLDLSVTYVEYFDATTPNEAPDLLCNSEATSICSQVAPSSSCDSRASFVTTQPNRYVRSESSSSSSTSSPTSKRRGHPKDTRHMNTGKPSVTADHDSRVASLRNLSRLNETEVGSRVGMLRKTGRPKLPGKVTGNYFEGDYLRQHSDLGPTSSIDSGRSIDSSGSPPSAMASRFLSEPYDSSDGSGSTPSSPNSTGTLIDSVPSETSLTEDTGNDDLVSSETDADDHSTANTTTTTDRYRLPGNLASVTMVTEKKLENRPPSHLQPPSRLVCRQSDQRQLDKNVGRKYYPKPDVKRLPSFPAFQAQKHGITTSGTSSISSGSSDIQRIDTFGQVAETRPKVPINHPLKLSKSTSSTDLHGHVPLPTQTSVNHPAERPTGIALSDGTAPSKNQSSRLRVPISPTVPVRTLRRVLSSDSPATPSSNHSTVSISSSSTTISKTKPVCKRDQAAMPPRSNDSSRVAACQKDYKLSSAGPQRIPQSSCVLGVRSSKSSAIPGPGRLSAAAETVSCCPSLQHQLSPISEKTAHEPNGLESTQVPTNDDISRGSCSPLKSPVAVAPCTQSLSTSYRATSLSKIPLGKSAPNAAGAIPVKPEIHRSDLAAGGLTPSRMLPTENISKMIEISQSHTDIYERTAKETSSPLRGGNKANANSCLALNVSTDSYKSGPDVPKPSGRPTHCNPKNDSRMDTNGIPSTIAEHIPDNLRHSDLRRKEEAKESNQRPAASRLGLQAGKSSNLKTPIGFSGKKTEKKNDIRDASHCATVKSSPRASVSETVLEKTKIKDENNSAVTPTSVFKQLQLKHVKPYTSASNRGASITEKFAKGHGIAERRKLSQKTIITDRHKDVQESGNITQKQPNLTLLPAAVIVQSTDPESSSPETDECHPQCHNYDLETKGFGQASVRNDWSKSQSSDVDDFSLEYLVIDAPKMEHRSEEMMSSNSAAETIFDDDASPVASPVTPQNDISGSILLDLHSLHGGDLLTDETDLSSMEMHSGDPIKTGSSLKSHLTIDADFETHNERYRLNSESSDTYYGSIPLDRDEFLGENEYLFSTNKAASDCMREKILSVQEDSEMEIYRTDGSFSRHGTRLREKGDCNSFLLEPMGGFSMNEGIQNPINKQDHVGQTAALRDVRGHGDSFLIKSTNRNSLVLPNKILVQQDSAFRDIDKFIVTYESENIIVLERAESISCPTPQSLELKDVVFEVTPRPVIQTPNKLQTEGMSTSRSADLKFVTSHKAESCNLPLSESGYDSWKSQSSKASTRLMRPSESDVGIPEDYAKRQSALDVLSSGFDKNGGLPSSPNSTICDLSSRIEQDSEDETSSALTETNVTMSKKRVKPVINIFKRDNICADVNNSNPELSARITPTPVESQTPTNSCCGYFQDDVVLKDGLAGSRSSDFRSCSIPSSSSSLLETIESINFSGTSNADECSSMRTSDSSTGQEHLFNSETASPDRKSWSFSKEPNDGNDYAFGSCFELSMEGMAFQSRDYHNRIYKLDFETERESGELVVDDDTAETESCLRQGASSSLKSDGNDPVYRRVGEIPNETVNSQSLKSSSKDGRNSTIKKNSEKDGMHSYTFPLDSNRCVPNSSKELFRRQQLEAETVVESVEVFSSSGKKRAGQLEKDTFYEHMCDALLESLEADLSDSENTPSPVDNDLTKSVERDSLVVDVGASDLRMCEQVTGSGTRPSSSEFQVCLAQSSSSPELLDHLSNRSRVFSEEAGELKRSVAFSRLDSLSESTEAELRPLSDSVSHTRPCPLPVLDQTSEKKAILVEPNDNQTLCSRKDEDAVLESGEPTTVLESKGRRETQPNEWISQYYIEEPRNDGRDERLVVFSPKQDDGWTEEPCKCLDDSSNRGSMLMSATNDVERGSLERKETKDPEEVSIISSSSKEESKVSSNLLTRYFPGLMRKQAKDKNNSEDPERSGKKQDKWSSLRNSGPPASKNERKSTKGKEPDDSQTVKDVIRIFEDKKAPMKAVRPMTTQPVADRSSQVQEQKTTSGKVIKSKFGQKQKPQ